LRGEIAADEVEPVSDPGEALIDEIQPAIGASQQKLGLRT
jgi:hypothetical protein